MNLKSLILPLALLLPMAVNAQSITPAQIEQFKSLPQAQQEALARQYGIDLDNFSISGPQDQRPRRVDVVSPLRDTGEQGDGGAARGEQGQGLGLAGRAAEGRTGGRPPLRRTDGQGRL